MELTNCWTKKKYPLVQAVDVTKAFINNFSEKYELI